jgi:hypothetical protein
MQNTIARGGFCRKLPGKLTGMSQQLVIAIDTVRFFSINTSTTATQQKLSQTTIAIAVSPPGVQQIETRETVESEK